MGLLDFLLPTPPTRAKNVVNDLSVNLSSLDNSLKQLIEDKCVNNTSQSNIINIINSKLKDVNANQKNVAKNICAFKTVFEDNIDTVIKSNIANAIVQTAEAKGSVGLFTGAAITENITNSEKIQSTLADNSRNLTAVTECLSTLNQSNIINFINSEVEGSEFKQLNKHFGECLKSMDIDVGVDSVVETDTSLDVDQEGKAKGGDWTASLGAVAGIILFIMCSCCIFIALSSLASAAK